MHKKVLMTCPKLQLGGGVASYCRVLYPHIVHDTEYFTVGERGGERKGYRIIFRLIIDYIRFLFIINRTNYDVVHLNPSLGVKALLRDCFFLKIAKFKKCTVVVFIHGWDEKFESQLLKKYLFVFQKMYFQADAFIVLAEEFKNKLENMGFKKNIFVETTTVDNRFFELPLPSHGGSHFQLLFLSRIEKEKGIYETIDAYWQIKKKNPYITLLVAGDGSELPNVRSYVFEKGISGIEFSGYIEGEQKDAAFLKSNLFLFPTFYGEGMPINILEAMASGLPIVTRPVGGLKDFFKDGEMGFISAAKNPNTFSELVESLLIDRNLCRKIGQYNRKYAQTHFSPSCVSHRLNGIYNLVENEPCENEKD